jgi:two-component system, chemotaxis family, protein-glutamate methylesterase/glutaminase
MPIESKTLNVVAVGASAGGVEALSRFAAGLPPDLPYAVLVALHLPTRAPSVLARILDRNGPLPAAEASDGAPLEPGTIRVAVPDRHLLVCNHRVALSQGPTENGHRPAINSLFRSVAVSFGRHAVSVLLSGVLDDGTLGCAAIRSRGGTTIAQTPGDALFPAMPRTAIEAGVVDHQVAAGEVGSLLMRLADRPIEQPSMKHDASMDLENRIAPARRFSPDFNTEDSGAPSGYTCPDCNSSLIDVSEGNYRCHVGHAWTADALLETRDSEVDGALWVAMRSLQEKAKLSRRLAGQVDAGILRDRYRAIADETEHAMSVLGSRLSDFGVHHEQSGD